MKNNHWYRFKAQADEAIANVYIFREIGKPWFGETDTTVTAEQFCADLAALPAAVTKIRVHINSPGGDPFEATVIANALREQRATKGRQVEVIIEGLAASAATVISCAGSPIRIAENGLMMIHDPFILAIGNAGELRKEADNLDKIRDAIIATYRWVSSKSVDDLSAMMAAETWMNADEAIAAGLATEKIGATNDDEGNVPLPAPVVARLRVPAAYRDRVAALVERPALPPAAAANSVVVLRLCREAGVLALTEELIASGATEAQARARVDREVEALARTNARAADIKALCEFSKLPMLADTFIRSSLSSDDVRHTNAIISALRDNQEIDTYLAPDWSPTKSASGMPSAAAVYAARNKAAEKKGAAVR